MSGKRFITTPRIAILIGLIDIILIFMTLRTDLPLLQLEFKTPFPQILYQPEMWFKLAETLFHSGGLIMVYGLMSLLFPKLRFTLQFGSGIANLAGVSYLFSLVMSYRYHEHGPNIELAIIMFMLCMILPFLISKVIGFIDHG